MKRFRNFLCWLWLHDWEYFSMLTVDTASREYYRCCMSCEKTEFLGREFSVNK